MVRLPHRADRPIDQVAGAVPALAAAGDQGPEARPEVRPTEDRVQGHADPQHGRDCVSLAHELPASVATAGGGSSFGPYGTSTSSPGLSRQRRAMPRRITIVAAPSSV